MIGDSRRPFAAAAALAALLAGLSGCASPLHKAIGAGDADSVRGLLARGASLQPPPGTIPYVYSACSYGNLAVLQALVEGGADIDAGDGGATAYQQCLRKGKKDMAEYLRARGAKGAPPETIAAAPAQPPPSPRATPVQTPASSAPSSDVDAPARRGPPRPDDFALVIGIEEYQSLPKAEFGESDARTVRQHLEALGFPPRNIVTLAGAHATGNKMRSYLEEWLPLNVKPSSTLFVYYSGHGAPDPRTGEAYLVPWDGDPSFLKTTAYSLRKFYADLGKIKARRVLVALDACFSGAGGKSVLARGARPLVAKVADAETPSSVTVLAAASGDEITGSLPDQGHGMFTYFLLKGLAAGKRSAAELHDYLSPLVQDEARRQNRSQTPVRIGDGSL